LSFKEEATASIAEEATASIASVSRLRNAVKDAETIADELRKNGFIVTLRKDLTGEELRKELRRFFAIKGDNQDARLLLWFSGHGHTIDGEGFLVPADAPVPTSKQFKVSSLHMRDFGGLVRLAESRHVLSIFDSCFAGTIFNTRAGLPSPVITRATVLPVRQFLTSGDVDQQVSDDGSFRELFLSPTSTTKNVTLCTVTCYRFDMFFSVLHL